jgi:hypothetical protein
LHRRRIRIPGNRSSLAADDAGKAGPKRLSLSFMEWQVRQALLKIN